MREPTAMPNRYAASKSPNAPGSPQLANEMTRYQRISYESEMKPLADSAAMTYVIDPDKPGTMTATSKSKSSTLASARPSRSSSSRTSCFRGASEARRRYATDPSRQSSGPTRRLRVEPSASVRSRRCPTSSKATSPGSRPTALQRIDTFARAAGGLVVPSGLHGSATIE